LGNDILINEVYLLILYFILFKPVIFGRDVRCVARHHTSSAMLLVFGILKQILMNLKHASHNFYYQQIIQS